MKLKINLVILLLLISLAISDINAKMQSINETEVKKRPNIIFILSDDLSYRDLSIYGQKHYLTPNLDQLARSGVRFTQAYAGAPECAPSRCTLMTGLNLAHCTIRNNSSARGQDHLTLKDVTVAMILQKAGYTTAITGKWGLGLPGTVGVPYKKGFDYAFGYYDEVRAHTYFPLYLYENSQKIYYPGNIGFDLNRVYDTNVPNPKLSILNKYNKSGKLDEPHAVTYSEDEIEKAAFKFIRVNRDKPFFLYFTTQLPHGPIITDDLGALTKRKDFPDQRDKEWAAMVRRIDTFTGQLIDSLKSDGIYKNTVIFFASDNGYSMCGYMGRGNKNNNWPDDPYLKNKGPFKGGKFSPLEGGIRVPFFVNWPGHFKPSIRNQPVCFIDFFKTATDIAGIHYPGVTDGESLLPLLDGNPQKFNTKRILYWSRDREEAIRMGPWKAYRKNPEAPIKLYLINEDTYCNRNIAKLYSKVINKIKKLFIVEESDPSVWYWNPTETNAEFEKKQEKARQLGQIQYQTFGNDIAPRWAPQYSHKKAKQ